MRAATQGYVWQRQANTSAAVLVGIVNTLGHYSGSICRKTGGHRCDEQKKKKERNVPIREGERVVVAVGSPVAGVGQK